MSSELSSALSPGVTGSECVPSAVAIVDLGLVDCAPLQVALDSFGVASFCTSHRVEMLEAAALILPDAPSFADYARVFALKRVAQIVELRISGGRPVLACGTAMHLLCEGIDSGGGFTASPAPQWEGRVVELPSSVPASVHVPICTSLFEGIEGLKCPAPPAYGLRTDPAEGMDAGPLTPPRSAWAGPPTPYVAAIDNGALCAMAWDPHEAGDLGVRLLSNWLERLPAIVREPNTLDLPVIPESPVEGQS
ncbi:hypothetical protein [Schaalia sp. Marseille-Q2122]|uniref:hypothetical protein n=1 Tax=Schaalia sp. Marseille-Q2122 TaxID=2736604 RepID=UPI0015888E3C|nr:hypothetical protein [Schaalia sp. Marseille-Q2122]